MGSSKREKDPLWLASGASRRAAQTTAVPCQVPSVGEREMPCSRGRAASYLGPWEATRVVHYPSSFFLGGGVGSATAQRRYQGNLVPGLKRQSRVQLDVLLVDRQDQGVNVPVKPANRTREARLATRSDRRCIVAGGAAHCA